ncbi:MAG: FHA domain-containing protein [Planctomycetota bacterium]
MTTQRTLEIVEPADAKRTVQVEGAPWMIGRQQGCQLVLQHSSVSRQHAKLIQDPTGDTLITDLESSNGTKLNGEDLTPHAPYRLRPGDVLTLGVFKLQWSGPPVEPTMAPDASTPIVTAQAVAIDPPPAAPAAPAAAPPAPEPTPEPAPEPAAEPKPEPLPEPPAEAPAEDSIPEALPVETPAAPASAETPPSDEPPVSSPPLVPAEPSQAPPEPEPVPVAAAPPAPTPPPPPPAPRTAPTPRAPAARLR